MKQSLSDKIVEFLLLLNFPVEKPTSISIFALIFSWSIVVFSALLLGSFNTIGIILSIAITLLTLCLFAVFLIDYIKDAEKFGIIFESIVIIICLCANTVTTLFFIQYSHEGDYSSHDCVVDAPLCENNAECFIKYSCSFNRKYYCKEHFDDAIERLHSGDSSSTKKPSYNSSKPSFTNKYGTSTTKCYIYGCDNYIATSGDTNCCTKHSNLCLNCRCYIDSDAMYCMDCLEDALGK